MARKFYDLKIFTHTTQAGNTYNFYCYSQNTNYGFRHVCFLDDKTQEAKSCYYNRTWESFEYQTVLNQAIKKVARTKQDEQELITVLIERKKIQEQQETEQYLQEFETEYNKLPDNCKKALADSDIILTSQEQADSLMRSMKLINIMTALK